MAVLKDIRFICSLENELQHHFVFLSTILITVSSKMDIQFELLLGTNVMILLEKNLSNNGGNLLH